MQIHFRYFDYLESTNIILEFALNVDKFFGELKKFEKAKFIKIISSNCYLYNGKIELKLKEPFQILSKMTQNKNGSPNGIRTRVASVKGMCPNH